MAAQPPYLFGADGADSRPVRVTADAEARIIEVAVHGRWSRTLWQDAADALAKCFAEHPTGVIVDLHDLGDPDAVSAPAWWTAGMRAAELRPPVRLVMCVPSAAAVHARLQRMGARRSLPVFATMPEARAALAGSLHLTERQQVRLAPAPDAAAAARDLVDDVCRSWRLPDLRHPARLVLSELVNNAVEHAGTELVVTVSRRGAGIHLAVCDGDPRLPRLGDAVPEKGKPQGRGHGLHAVHAASTTWGAMPTGRGKVVWALVRGPAR